MAAEKERDGYSDLDEAYERSLESVDSLLEVVSLLEREPPGRLAGQKGLFQDEVRALFRLWRVFRGSLDAGPLPTILSALRETPVERAGLVAESVHSLVAQLVSVAVMRVWEVARPDSTGGSSPMFALRDIPCLDQDELKNADRRDILEAARIAPPSLGGPGPLKDEDFSWLNAALSQEYTRAKRAEGTLVPPDKPPVVAVRTARPVNRPPENAFKAWQLRELLGVSKQSDIAAEMTKQGIAATQGQVSKWLRSVEAWRIAGGEMPPVGAAGGKPQSLDPGVLDMGTRRDGRTARQRQRRDPDAGSDA